MNNTDYNYGIFGITAFNFRTAHNNPCWGHIKLYDTKGHLLFDKEGFDFVEYWGKPFAKYKYECTIKDDVITGTVKWWQHDIYIYQPRH